jgi:hypothetical protein
MENVKAAVGRILTCPYTIYLSPFFIESATMFGIREKKAGD